MPRLSLSIGLLASALLCGCVSPQKPAASASPTPQTGALAPTAVPTAAAELGSLKITDIVLGTGEEAVAGRHVTVNYTGRLLSGAQFDSSIGRAPFTFVLGQGDVIKGWDLGVAGMKVGGKRELVIPPHLGYGSQGAGNVIPPDATLVFEVELLAVQ
jgi:FKBP-type peptidyl-prolyl cis-trans isomerase